ncbi:MAG: hypothetical protein GQ527_08865 [Bacteroidales bacterium]|nr:hypothetical protein [Bacteroidales bacterium]
MKTSIIILITFASFTAFSQDSLLSIKYLCNEIAISNSEENKLKLNEKLLISLKAELQSNTQKLEDIDSTGLLFELQSSDQMFQIVSWAIQFEDEWEYFGFLKSYHQNKKEFEVMDLTPTDYIQSSKTKGVYSHENWPAGVYYKLIETTYNKRKYYTLLGWIAPSNQTAHKFIEVITLSKNGRPSFGKSAYFSIDKEYKNRMLFSYNSQSNFQLDYGEYSYSERKWNRKKKKYDENISEEYLLVFDHLIPLYPDLADHPEFLVPVGNTVDAFAFIKGKWRMKHDIDARNLKIKKKKTEKPNLNLLPDL